MSDQYHIPSELNDLFDDYLDGGIAEERLAELESRLRVDPEARRLFVRYCRLDTDLHLEAQARQAGERALRKLDLTTPAPLPVATSGEPASPRIHKFRTGRWLLAATAALAAGIGWWTVGSLRAAGDPDVAWLVNAQDCLWADGSAPAGGMRAGHRLKVEHGLAEIAFESGARVVLEGPADLELLTGNSARLAAGKLSARVPESAKGFQVLSRHGRVVDLGTEFGMSVAEDGSADVVVFKGQVEAHAGSVGAPVVGLAENQAARIDSAGVSRRETPAAGPFVRAVVPPPVVVPRTLALDFTRSASAGLHDGTGAATGLTHRLPGTGSKLAANDGNLRLNAAEGQLELTTTDSDLNHRYKLADGEYLGVRLSDLGFTGTEDFEVTVLIPNIPSLKAVGQFGLFAGSSSNKNIRGGLISLRKADQYSQFLVNNTDGRDRNLYSVGLLSTGANLRLTLRRASGKYHLTVENLTTGGSSTLNVVHPEFLDGERDLYVGLFGANTQSDERRTLVFRDFRVTVRTLRPAL